MEKSRGSRTGYRINPGWVDKGIVCLILCQFSMVLIANFDWFLTLISNMDKLINYKTFIYYENFRRIGINDALSNQLEFLFKISIVFDIFYVVFRIIIEFFIKKTEYSKKMLFGTLIISAFGFVLLSYFKFTKTGSLHSFSISHGILFAVLKMILIISCLFVLAAEFLAQTIAFGRTRLTFLS